MCGGGGSGELRRKLSGRVNVCARKESRTETGGVNSETRDRRKPYSSHSLETTGGRKIRLNPGGGGKGKGRGKERVSGEGKKGGSFYLPDKMGRANKGNESKRERAKRKARKRGEGAICSKK